MKRKLLFLTALVVSVFGLKVHAQEPGTYYIQNVETGRWLGPGNKWGTQASVLEHADYWKLAKVSDGVYTLESVVDNRNNSYYFNGTFCDGGATNFTFTPIEGKDGVYSINNNGQYITALEGSTVVNNSASNGESPLAQWKLYSEEDMQEMLKTADIFAPVDATFLIKDHDTGRNNRDVSNWENSGATEPKSNVADSETRIYSREAFQKVFNVYQELENVPNGIYAVQVNGFYRQDGNDNKLPYVYANDAKTTLPVKTGTENDMQSAAEAFVKGEYLSDLAVVKVTDGKLKIGVATEGTTCWSIFKNFHLYYYGDNDKYYLQNVSSGKYWGAENDWGTQASLVKNPEFVTLIPNESGAYKYKLESQVANGGTNYYFNGEYMDKGNTEADALTITKVGENYTISGVNGYYGYNSSSTVLGKNLESNSPDALWKIISEEEMIASLAYATAESPVDATFLLLDPNFGRNNRHKSAWNPTGNNCTIGGSGNGANCAESFQSTFSISQTIKNAPKGVYKFTANGFYRQDGEDNENLPIFYINDEETKFPVRTGTENDMATACTSFKNGNYAIEPMFIELEEEGEITVGAKLENNALLWCIWDNFELTYYGAEASLADVKFGDLVKQVNELRERATVLAENENVSAVTVTALKDAIAKASSIEPEEDAYNAVIAALSAAITQANRDIDNKPAIDALYALAESTNVYTAEAYDTFMKMVDDYKAEFDAGTLTETVVNPDIVAGWHSANDFDDFLLSAWTIGGEQAKDFDTALYINTWSTEGGNDGTNFRVPFFEYWTADANSLGANKLSATVTALPAGAYEVSAWVRVRAKNGTSAADANGVTLSVNEGTAVDVTEGKTVGAFNLAEYKAIGTVGEDGNLVITFDVADGNNISWLSFKNVKFEKVDAASDEEVQALEDAIAAVKDNMLGFEDGEYAPYNNIEALAALAAAKKVAAINPNRQDAVVEATKALTAAEWTANEGNVEAVYNGNFAEGQGSPADDIQKYGWTRTNGWGQFRDDTKGAQTSYYNQPGSLQYGNAGLYTMPLKAKTVYTLTFSYASWEEGSNKDITVTVLNDEDGTKVPMKYEGNPNVHTESLATKTFVFVTGKAGDYILTLANTGNTVITDVSIMKAESQELVFKDGEDLPSYAEGTYPTVKIERTFTEGKWATAVYPFAIGKDDVKEIATLTSFKEGVLGFITDEASVANKPCLIKANGEIVLKNVEVAKATVEETEADDAIFKGVYKEMPINSDAKNAYYVLSNNALHRVSQNTDTPATVGAYRAYIQVPAAAEVKERISVDGEATAIEDIEIAADKAVSGEIYNLAGQRVAQPTKGIYIVNGKKVLIK